MVRSSVHCRRLQWLPFRVSGASSLAWLGRERRHADGRTAAAMRRSSLLMRGGQRKRDRRQPPPPATCCCSAKGGAMRELVGELRRRRMDGGLRLASAQRPRFRQSAASSIAPLHSHRCAPLSTCHLNTRCVSDDDTNGGREGGAADCGKSTADSFDACGILPHACPTQPPIEPINCIAAGASIAAHAESRLASSAAANSLATRGACRHRSSIRALIRIHLAHVGRCPLQLEHRSTCCLHERGCR